MRWVLLKFLWVSSLWIVSCTGADVSLDKNKTTTENPETIAKVKLAKSYILALSSDSYLERATAKTKLMELGRPAIEPLEAGVRSEDSETRLRSMEILIAMRGRGFLGIGLHEENVDVPDPEEGDPQKSEATAKLGSVMANQIIGFKQFGGKRPLPAEAATMEAGDRVLEVNGRAIHGIKDLMAEVIVVGPGRVVHLLIERRDKLISLNAMLTRNPTPLPLEINNRLSVLPPENNPVDLESEIDFSEDDKRSKTKDNKNSNTSEMIIEEDLIPFDE